jgi:hypothetical protein
MHQGLPCSKEKELESVVLHDVVLQAPLQQLSSRWKTSCDDEPTCDDMRILFN